MAQEAYRQDQLDLQKDYIRKMKLLLQNYFTNQLAALYALNGGDINSLTQDFDGEAVKNIPANLQHLADTIIKSQLRRNQKKRFFDKVVNTSQTLEHMRTWNAAEKARERYYEQAYNDSSDYLNSESNALLREARASSDARYRSALYNMYKYLDNGAKITEDILGDMVIEAKAKAKLLKEGVDIFKTTEAAAPKWTGVSAVQAQDSAKLKSLNEAKQKAEKEAEKEAKNGNKNKTPAELDQMYQIEEPADEVEWGLSPTGSHWDMKDINDLINSDPELYTSRTDEGKEAIKTALSLQPKYTKTDEENKKEEEKKTSSDSSNNEGGNVDPGSNNSSEKSESEEKPKNIKIPSYSPLSGFKNYNDFDDYRKKEDAHMHEYEDTLEGLLQQGADKDKIKKALEKAYDKSDAKIEDARRYADKHSEWA